MYFNILKNSKIKLQNFTQSIVVLRGSKKCKISAEGYLYFYGLKL